MEYWYLWLILAVLVAITAAVIVLAGKSVSAHNEQTREFMSQLERLKELKDKYKDLTAEKAESADPEELLEGVNAVLQAKLEKSDDIDKAYNELNPHQQVAYVLDCFINEVPDGLSTFFDEYTLDFAGFVIPALSAVKGEALLPTVTAEFEMYDDGNDSVPFDRELKEKLDSEFAKVYSREKLLSDIKDFIKANADEF